MKFDDHEIWGAPVRVSEPEAEAPLAPAPVVATAAEGTLYRSAGSAPHPDAIVALPHHKRKAIVDEPALQAPAAAPVAPAAEEAPAVAPITINSQIPRPTIADAAIAELVAPIKTEKPVGYESWFKPSTILAKAPANLADAKELASRFNATSVSIEAISPAQYFLLVFAVTTVVGIVNALINDALGLPTGAALLLATGFAALRIDARSRWAAWVLPVYALIGTILIAGQLTAGAPGVSPIGQLMLIATTCISLAPWLALATLAGALLPRFSGKRAPSAD